MTNFNDVAIGERFYFDGCDYIKTCNPQSGKTGAVHICTGTYRTDCENWKVISPIQPTKEKQKEEGLHQYRLFSTYGETLDWIEITDEQIHLLEYLQSNNLLGDNVDFEECGIANFKKI